MERELVNHKSFWFSIIPLSALCQLMLFWTHGVLD
jgi:hypothetical protein